MLGGDGLSDWLGRLRDAAFGPLARLPLLRGETLKVLAGVKRGLFGRVPLAANPAPVGDAVATQESARQKECLHPLIKE